MSKRRTREQKIIASLRKKIEVQQTPKRSEVEKKPTLVQNYQPERQLPIQVIYKDLLKTVFVTIAGVIIQLGIKAYLDRGGWDLVRKLSGV